jgi:hypothetical protein
MLQFDSGEKSVLITSALTALGFNFAKAPDDSNMLVPIAGEWHLKVLLESLYVDAEGSLTLRLVSALGCANRGPDRGKLFEYLCIHRAVRLVAASVAPDARRAVGEIFPFLRDTSAATATLGRRLRIRQLPSVTSSCKKELSEERLRDASLKTIHPSDLRRVLYEVLREDEIGIPRGNSGSQDWFLRAKGAMICFSNKMVLNLQCQMVADELDKRPVVQSDDGPCVLVTLAPVLGQELASALGETSSALLLTEAEVRNHGCRPETTALILTTRRDVVIVSPSHADGLRCLLTDDVFHKVQRLAAASDAETGTFLQQMYYQSESFFSSSL